MQRIAPGAEVDGERLVRVDLTCVRAPDVSLVDCVLDGCAFDGARLDGAREQAHSLAPALAAHAGARVVTLPPDAGTGTHRAP